VASHAATVSAGGRTSSHIHVAGRRDVLERMNERYRYLSMRQTLITLAVRIAAVGALPRGVGQVPKPT
jgi:hypothetical protein